MKLRTAKLVDQIKLSFIFKFLSVVISFLLVRFLLKLLEIEDYGLWSVVITFLNWIVFFDLGIANGVKNKLSESLSEDRIEDARGYISTGYISLFAFSFFVYVVVLTLSNYINWQNTFNVYYHSNDYLRVLVLIILFFTLMNFTLSLVNTVFNSIQKASLAVFSQFLTQLFSLFFVLILIEFSESDLHLLAFGYGVSMLVCNLSMSIWFFKKNGSLTPKLRCFEKTKAKIIMSLGLRFFVLQTMMLIILLSDRFILVQLVSTSEVTRYDVIFKYFNIIIILHTLINAPLWSIYTEAYNKKDYKWIEKTMSNLGLLIGAYMIILIVMIFAGKYIIKIWLNNDQLELTIINYCFMATLIFFSIVHSTLSYFTNGIGKTNLQLVTSIIGAIVNIPLSIYFVNILDLGLNGVILATIISLSFFCVIGPFQVKREINLLKIEVLNSKKNLA